MFLAQKDAGASARQTLGGDQTGGASADDQDVD